MMLAAQYDVMTAIVIAPAVGSFLSVLITRLPRHEDVVVRASHCPRCDHDLAARDLVPVASFVLNKGQCRFCHAAISSLYPAVEILALGLAVWASTVVSGWLLLITCVLGWTLLALAVMDARELVLSDALTLPLIGSGLIVSFLLVPELLPAHVIGAVAGFTLIVGARFVYANIRHREGLGLGDAKLLAAAGAWLSWEALGGVILIAAVSTVLATLAASLFGQRLTAVSMLPFGPGLALGFWVSWLYGPLLL